MKKRSIFVHNPFWHGRWYLPLLICSHLYCFKVIQPDKNGFHTSNYKKIALMPCHQYIYFSSSNPIAYLLQLFKKIFKERYRKSWRSWRLEVGIWIIGRSEKSWRSHRSEVQEVWVVCNMYSIGLIGLWVWCSQKKNFSRTQQQQWLEILASRALLFLQGSSKQKSQVTAKKWLKGSD